MSRDQKPKAVKAVAVIGSGGAPADGADAPQGADADHGAEGHAPAKPAFPLVPALLFLIGCIIGGAALTALPHVRPETAALLYGNAP